MADNLWDTTKEFVQNHIDDHRAVARLKASMAESAEISDQRQMSLWQQTMEIGRQARQQEPQQDSPQEQEHQRRQLSL